MVSYQSTRARMNDSHAISFEIEEQSRGNQSGILAVANRPVHVLTFTAAASPTRGAFQVSYIVDLLTKYDISYLPCQHDVACV